MKYFRVKTLAGTDDFCCSDFDDSDKDEYWFTSSDGRRVYVKSNVISIQEMPPANQKGWDELAAESEEYSRIIQNRLLNHRT